MAKEIIFDHGFTTQSYRKEQSNKFELHLQYWSSWVMTFLWMSRWGIQYLFMVDEDDIITSS